MKKGKTKSKKSQITIFVIIALIIIAALILVFVLVRRAISPAVPVTPDAEIGKCISDSLSEAESRIIEGNFYTNISDNYEVYYGEKVKYLCKASEFYSPCVNQEPALIEMIRKEIYNIAKAEIEGCFNSMTAGFERNGYDVKMNDTRIPISIIFEGGNIGAEINKSITLKKGEEARSFSGFSGKAKSPLFNLAKTAATIVNFESTLCDFNPSSWMSAYPDVFIKIFVTGDGTKIYTLTDAETEKAVSFAVKSCVLPAGL